MSTIPNRTLINQAKANLHAVLGDLEEKISMIEAEETHGAEWADRGDDFDKAKELLEQAIDNLNTASDYL